MPDTYYLNAEPKGIWAADNGLMVVYNDTHDKLLKLRDLAVRGNRYEGSLPLSYAMVSRISAFANYDPEGIIAMDSASPGVPSGIVCGSKGSVTITEQLRRLMVQGRWNVRTRAFGGRTFSGHRVGDNAEMWGNSQRVSGSTQSIVLRPGQGLALTNSNTAYGGSFYALPNRVYCQFRVDVAGTPTYLSQSYTAAFYPEEVFFAIFNGSASNIVYVDMLDLQECFESDVATIPFFVVVPIVDMGSRTGEDVGVAKADSASPDLPEGILTKQQVAISGLSRPSEGEAMQLVDGSSYGFGGGLWWTTRQYQQDSPWRLLMCTPNSVAARTHFNWCPSLMTERVGIREAVFPPGYGFAVLGSRWDYIGVGNSGQWSLAAGLLSISATVTLEDYTPPAINNFTSMMVQ